MYKEYTNELGRKRYIPASALVRGEQAVTCRLRHHCWPEGFMRTSEW